MTLAAYLAATGRSQSAVADELGISKSYLSMLLSHQRHPSGALALRIAETCRVPLESLFRARKKVA